MKKHFGLPNANVVGVAENSYVVGFTGTSKRNWFTEENSSVKNSFSLWRPDDPQIVSRIEDQTDYGSFQDEVRIVASDLKPLFVTYHRLSNTLYLYWIGQEAFPQGLDRH